MACFSATPMGTEVVVGGGLPMGTSQAASEELLQQTAEAVDARLTCAPSAAARSVRSSDRLLPPFAEIWKTQRMVWKRRFEGVFDLRPLLEAVRRGRSLHPLQLNGVASTLQACLHQWFRILPPCPPGDASGAASQDTTSQEEQRCLVVVRRQRCVLPRLCKAGRRCVHFCPPLTAASPSWSPPSITSYTRCGPVLWCK